MLSVGSGCSVTSRRRPGRHAACAGERDRHGVGWAGWQGYGPGPGPARPSGPILRFLLRVASFRETEAENCNQITVNKVNRLTVCMYALLCLSSVGRKGARNLAARVFVVVWWWWWYVCVWRKGIHGRGGGSDEKLGSATL